MKKTLGILVLAMMALVGNDAAAGCASHSCGGVGINVNVRVAIGGGYGYGGYGVCGGGWGGGWGGCGGWGYGGWFGPRPFFGRGAVAFRRAFRLERRAMRAASLGFFGRAARLDARARGAFARGQARFLGVGVNPLF